MLQAFGWGLLAGSSYFLGGLLALRWRVGNSVLLGIQEAKARKAWTVGLTGGTGGKLKEAVDCCVCVPSPRTAHIQECHIALIHAICACVDEAFLTAKV